MNKFGAELGEFLKIKNISIKKFAEEINVTPNILIDIINRKVKLSQKMIYRISLTTNIPFSYIENTEKNYKIDNEIKMYLRKNNLTINEYMNKFNYKELFNKYHIKYTDSKNNYAIIRDALRHFNISSMEELEKLN